MKRLLGLISLGALAAAFALGVPSAASLAADAYLKIKDIPGESRASGHEGQIELLSWSWGSTGRDAPSGMASGKRQYEPLTITKSVDQASPLLQRASETGQQLSGVTVYMRKAGGKQQEYMKIELENVMVSSYSVGGSGGGGGAAPTETFSLNYEKIKQGYVPEGKPKEEGQKPKWDSDKDKDKR